MEGSDGEKGRRKQRWRTGLRVPRDEGFRLLTETASLMMFTALMIVRV